MSVNLSHLKTEVAKLGADCIAKAAVIGRGEERRLAITLPREDAGGYAVVEVTPSGEVWASMPVGRIDPIIRVLAANGVFA